MKVQYNFNEMNPAKLMYQPITLSNWCNTVK